MSLSPLFPSISRKSKFLFVGVFHCFFASALVAATYYVDFVGGKDSQQGTSATTAFQHCPGDRAAAGVCASTVLSPGDTVIFKGGVAYRGEITLKAIGTAEKPIILDGNTVGNFGTGRAIIEGAESINGWKRCANAEEAMGNPKWESIWYSDALPPDADFYAVNLCQGDVMYHVAVYPCSETLAVWNDTEVAITPKEAPDITNPEEHHFTDPYFSQTSPDAWNGGFIGIRAGRNFFFMSEVTRYIPDKHEIFFKGIKEVYPSLDKQRFVMLNALPTLTQPGQYVLQPQPQGGKRLYCIPMEGKGFPEGATTGKRESGIFIDAGKYVTIRGFIIQNQTEQKRGRGIAICSADPKNEQITIEDNIIRQQKSARGVRSPAVGITGVKGLVIRKNQIKDILGIGMLLTKCDDLLFEDNIFDSVLDTTVDFYTCKDVKCLRNRVSGRSGLHANGLTFYLGNENILVEGNVVAHENPLTLQDLKGARIVNNLFDGIGRANGICIWADKKPPAGPVSNIVIEHNTVINASRDPNLSYGGGLYTASKEGENWTIRNNIFDGAGGNYADKVKAGKATMTNNLFLRSSNNPLGENAIVEEDPLKVFVNPTQGDYHLKAGSPAIGVGIASDVKTDNQGNARIPAKPDLGAYTYSK